MSWAALRWVLLMFLIAPGMEAPLVAHLNQPVKPIKTWVGNSSWYGPGFDGRKTANGERFDSEALTAAHPNLPFGSVVRVVNPRNGKFEIVRINDRGPYQEGREIDVSYRVARKIGLIHSGVSQVKFAKQIADLVGMFKIGNQLFTAAGPAAVKEISALGPGIFLDLKFHDIPNTVAGAVLSSAAMTGVQLVNVHALGGKAMLEAAVQAISAGVPMGADRPRLLAVTVLTSMDQKAMKEVGITGAPKLRVVKLAQLAKRVGVDGVVASVQEARAIRKACGRDFLIVTPGVRPKDSTVEPKSEDQSRKATPTEAIRAGADFLVVGRPIIAAGDPRAAAQAIVEEIGAAK